MQLDLFATAAALPPPPLIVAPVIERASLTSRDGRDPRHAERAAPWGLPSRLFQFPVTIEASDDGDAVISLHHPLLADHPYVRELEAETGIKAEFRGGFDFGTSNGTWHHAVDLVSTGHWHDLLGTARFTTPELIAGAVDYGLRHGPRKGGNAGTSTSSRRGRCCAPRSAKTSRRTAAPPWR